MLLWTFVSNCDSCSCVRVCTGCVYMCVQGGVCARTYKGVRVCLHEGVCVRAMISAAELYC